MGRPSRNYTCHGRTVDEDQLLHDFYIQLGRFRELAVRVALPLRLSIDLYIKFST